MVTNLSDGTANKAKYYLFIVYGQTKHALMVWTTGFFLNVLANFHMKN